MCTYGNEGVCVLVNVSLGACYGVSVVTEKRRSIRVSDKSVCTQNASVWSYCFDLDELIVVSIGDCYWELSGFLCLLLYVGFYLYQAFQNCFTDGSLCIGTVFRFTVDEAIQPVYLCLVDSVAFHANAP